MAPQMGRRGAEGSVSGATFGQATSLVGAITLLLSAVPISLAQAALPGRGVLPQGHGSLLPKLYSIGLAAALPEAWPDPPGRGSDLRSGPPLGDLSEANLGQPCWAPCAAEKPSWSPNYFFLYFFKIGYTFLWFRTPPL